MRLENKKILVTGGAGFIGSGLVERLLRSNAVSVLDDLSSGKTDNVAEYIDRRNFKLIEGSLLDEKILEEVMGVRTLFFTLQLIPRLVWVRKTLGFTSMMWWQLGIC